MTLLILLTLLILPIITAEEIIPEEPKEKLSALLGGLNEETENVLERQIDTPILTEVISGLFRLSTEEVTWMNLMILLGMSFFLFLFLSDALQFTSFNEQTSLIISISMVIIMSAIGITRQILIFTTGLTASLNFFKEMGMFGKALTLLIIIAIFLFAHYLISIQKRNAKLLEAKEFGEKIHQSKKNIEDFSEEILELGK